MTELPNPTEGIEMPQGSGRPSTADAETFMQGNVGLPKGPMRRIEEAKSADARVARNGWMVAVVMTVAFGGTLTALLKQSQSILRARIPAVMMDGKSPAILVQTSPQFEMGKDFKFVSIPPQQVRAELGRFLSMRWGVSEIHARQDWPILKTYWLQGERQKKDFETWNKPVYESSHKDGWFRRVVLVSALWDTPRDLPDTGGQEVDARVDFREEDIVPTQTDPIRTQTYTTRLIFRIGEAVPISNMDEKLVFQTNNPLNFRVMKMYTKETAMVQTTPTNDLNGTPNVAPKASIAVPASLSVSALPGVPLPPVTP